MSSDPNQPDQSNQSSQSDSAQPAEHSDNEKSKLPERDDEGRKQAPNDRPGKETGEGETPVG